MMLLGKLDNSTGWLKYMENTSYIIKWFSPWWKRMMTEVQLRQCKCGLQNKWDWSNKTSCDCLSIRSLGSVALDEGLKFLSQLPFLASRSIVVLVEKKAASSKMKEINWYIQLRIGFAGRTMATQCDFLVQLFFIAGLFILNGFLGSSNQSWLQLQKTKCKKAIEARTITSPWFTKIFFFWNLSVTNVSRGFISIE